MGSESRTLVTARGGVRLDRVIADALGCSRRTARRLLREGFVRVDGRVVTRSLPVARGASVVVRTAGRPRAAVPANRARILWRGNGFLAVDKPAGMHSVRGRSAGSVAEYLAAGDPAQQGVASDRGEGGLLQRLDRDTSGVLLAAASDEHYRTARALIAERRLEKWYLALVAGELHAPRRIDIALARRHSRVVAARRHDRPLPAQTAVRPVEVGCGWSLVEAYSCSGAPHQVRVHLSLIGHPLIGDRTYGGPPAVAREGHLLHAMRVRLADFADVSAPVPEDFLTAYARLKRR